MINTKTEPSVLRGLSIWQSRKRQSISIFPVDEVRRVASLSGESSITAFFRRHFPCLHRYTRIWDDYYLIERLPPCNRYTFPQISPVEIALD